MRSLFDSPQETVCTVSALTARIRDLLDAHFPSATVLGEISSLTRAASGHVYFKLRDNQSVLNAVVFRLTAGQLRFQLREGLEVVVRGRVSLYHARSECQLIVDDIAPRGVGRQDAALRLLKEKLARLGYFAAERKRSLPRFPRRIALVTSPRGAAVRDMLEVLARRWPLADVLVCPVRVQGAEAPAQIAGMLNAVSQLAVADIILLARGGGSSEDLAPFNDERVARAIFQSPVPVVSAVGHEIDVTIADLVADFRALTPSEAAERVTPDRTQLLKGLVSAHARLNALLLGQLNAARQRLDGYLQRPVFRRPLERSRELGRRLDDLDERMRLAWRGRLERGRQQLASHAAQLESLSPLKVLARGYSLTRTPAGELIRSVTQTDVGERIEILLPDGRLGAIVDEIS